MISPIIMVLILLTIVAMGVSLPSDDDWFL